MKRLGDILAKKPIETLCDSRASIIKGRYYWTHIAEGKESARCSSSQRNKCITRAYRLVEKDVGRLGNTRLR